MAEGLQYNPTAQLIRIPTSGTGGHHSKRISSLQKITFKGVVKLGAGQIQDVKKQLEKTKASTKMLIDDRTDGNISTEMFRQMIGEYEKDQTHLNDRLLQLKASLLKEENEMDNIRTLSKSFKRYFSLEKLDRAAVCELIDKITVSKRYEVDGIKHQNITIYYNFIGNISEQKEIDQKDIQAADKSELSA